jgi:integrase
MLEKIKQANPNAEYVLLGGDGDQVKSFRKAWRKACEAAGLKGFLFRDLRPSAARNLVRAGVPRDVAMKITGHKTEDVFERYNITSTDDLHDAGTSLTEYLNQKRRAAAQSASWIISRAVLLKN